MAHTRIVTIFTGCLIAASWQITSFASGHCDNDLAAVQTGQAVPPSSAPNTANRHVNNYWTPERMRNAKPMPTGRVVPVPKPRWFPKYKRVPTKRPNFVPPGATNGNNPVELRNTQAQQPAASKNYQQNCN